MSRCAVCNKWILWSSYRDGESQYCSVFCLTYSGMPGFCERCVAETEDVPAPDTTFSTFGGSRLLGKQDRCPVCHSVVRRHVYLALVIPIWWRTRYRVIYTSRDRYVGRRLRAAGTTVR